MMHKKLILAAILCVSIHAWAITVTMTAKTEGGDKPVIVGTSNLPDGIDLMITLSRRESQYIAQSKAKIKDGAFRAGPFGQGNAGLNPGTYSLKITMPLATMQPPATWPLIGKDGAKLQGPLAKKAEFGGKIVEYATSLKIGDGQSVAEKDRAARAQSEADKHAWWLRSCKDTCNLAQTLALKRNESFNWDRCYYKCVADEPKKE